MRTSPTNSNYYAALSEIDSDRSRAPRTLKRRRRRQFLKEQGRQEKATTGPGGPLRAPPETQSKRHKADAELERLRLSNSMRPHEHSRPRPYTASTLHCILSTVPPVAGHFVDRVHVRFTHGRHDLKPVSMPAPSTAGTWWSKGREALRGGTHGQIACPLIPA